MNNPTPKDLVRDLAADLALVEDLHREVGNGFAWHQVMPEHYRDQLAECVELAVAADEGWPAAIRRALAAEAQVAALQKQVEGCAARIAAQGELLAKRAERSNP